MPRERGRALAALLAGVVWLVAPGLAGAAGEGDRPAPPRGPVLADSTGRVVGPVLRTIWANPPESGTTAGPIAEVAVTLGGHTVSLWANRERFLSYPQLPMPPVQVAVLLFGEGVCTGTPYLWDMNDDPLYADRLTPRYAIGPDQKLYLASGEPALPPSDSGFYGEYMEPPPGACLIVAFVGSLPATLPTVLLGDLSAEFPPPYRVQ